MRNGILAELHKSYRDGRLEFLVGAGASMAAGFPGWSRLVTRLVSRLLAKEHSSLALLDEDLEIAARIFIERFSRDPIGDLVRFKTGDTFDRFLAESLYGDHPHLAPSLVHLELAAALAEMGSIVGAPGRLLTLNFDDLLESAYGEITRGQTAGSVTTGRTRKGLSVIHLHGMLAADGKSNGHLVFSEGDYFWAATRNDWADKLLREVLSDKRKDLLLVGLSLGDPRLRRLLLERVSRGRGARVFALLDAQVSPRESPLIERLAHGFLSKHEQDYWRRWGLTVGYIEDRALLPFYLRRVRLGDRPSNWLDAGREFLKSRSSVAGDLYNPSVQNEIAFFLKNTLRDIRSRMRVPSGEQIELGAFVPSPRRGSGHIQLGFRTAEPFDEVTEDDRIDRSYAARRRLSVAKLDEPQGAAGRAFVQGVVIDARKNTGDINKHFTETMRVDWDAGRTFASLLCVPVFDGPSWVPLGVAYLSSEAVEPFWAKLDHGETDDLILSLRSTFRECLRYDDEQRR